MQRQSPLVGRVFAARRLHPSARLLPKQDGRHEIHASGSRRCAFRCNTGCRRLILPCKASSTNLNKMQAKTKAGSQKLIVGCIYYLPTCPVRREEKWPGTIKKRTPLKMTIAINAPCQYHSAYVSVFRMLPTYDLPRYLFPIQTNNLLQLFHHRFCSL